MAGHTVREAVPGSDVCVVNTCGFIDSAKEEAIDTILSVAKYKETGEVKKILVTGCLPQRYQREVMEELPEVDGVLGTGSYADIVPAVEQVMAGGRPRCFGDINAPVEEGDGSSPRPPTLPTSASPRGVTTAAPTASSPNSGAATAAAPWRASWRRPGGWQSRG